MSGPMSGPTEAAEPETCGLRVRCSAYPHVHRRTSVQVTVVHVLPWTVLDTGELQLKLQLGLARPPLRPK